MARMPAFIRGVGAAGCVARSLASHCVSFLVVFKHGAFTWQRGLQTTESPPLRPRWGQLYVLEGFWKQVTLHSTPQNVPPPPPGYACKILAPLGLTAAPYRSIPNKSMNCQLNCFRCDHYSSGLSLILALPRTGTPLLRALTACRRQQTADPIAAAVENKKASEEKKKD